MARADAIEGSDLQRTLVLLTVSSCTMLYSLTITIVNVTLPQLQGALSATPDQVAWVITLNLVATAVATPITGWIVARFGQRQVMIWAVVGFTISSLLCATATSLAPLLVYRIGQGAFGAPMVPLAQAIVVATYPPEKRAVAQGWFGVAVVLGPAIGPVLGGFLAEEYDWRWVFLLPVPLCVVALLMVLAFIEDRGRQDGARLDWTGFLALSVAVTCLQLVMDRGERLDWLEFDRDRPAHLRHGGELLRVPGPHPHARRPFISPSLFLDRNFAVGLVFVFVYGMLNFTPITLLPPLLQSLKGYPDSLIGYVLGSRGVGMVLGFFLAGRMGRLDPRVGMLAGLGLVALSGAMLMRFQVDTSFGELAWMGFIQGLGTGLMWVPLSIVTFYTLAPEKLPEAAALFHLLRNFGSSIFISLSVMAAVRTGRVSYAELSEHVSALKEATQLPWVIGPRALDNLPDLLALADEVERQAQLIGHLNAFALYTAAAVLTMPFLLLVRIRRR